MAWRAAKSLLVLHQQLRPHAPKAPAVTWGLVGDAAHSSTSDHAPKDFPGWGDNIVTAADFPDGYGLDAWTVLDSIRRSRDPRAKYGISRGRIWSNRVVDGVPAWTWRRYTGSDGHWDHGHLSVVGDKRADIPTPWQIGLGATAANTLEGDDMLTPQQIELISAMAYRIDATTYGADKTRGGPYANEPVWLVQQVKALVAAQAASAQREQDMLAAITALAAGGGNADTAAIVSVINARTADVTGLLTAQAERIAALEAEVADYHQAEAAAAQARADALTD